MAEKTVKINLKDLYQFLISECRYGYTRNNHLMPSGAYEKVKKYFPKMLKIDEDWAIHTLKQLCEECISEQLIMKFYDGEDDEYGSRNEAISFIAWCASEINKVDENWKPYNYDQYLKNVMKNTEPRYNIYEVNGQDKTLLTDTPVSQNDYLSYMFKYLGLECGSFRKETIKLTEDFNDRRKNYIYHIIEPIEKDFFVEHI